MACDQLTVIADREYYKGEQILACEQNGVMPLVPKTQTSSSTAAGRFDKRDFHYDANSDTYRCPANEEAIRRMATIEDGSIIQSTRQRPAQHALYTTPAPLHGIDASDAGSTRRCLRPCNSG
jgi:hypothetical protein